VALHFNVDPREPRLVSRAARHADCSRSIVSIGSLAFLYVGHSALLVTLGGTFIVSLPLVALESAWLRWLNIIMKGLVAPQTFKAQGHEQATSADAA
jgi:hypothetical protein